MGQKFVEGNLEENIWRKRVEMAPSRIRAAVGVTHNLGDFNSVRIDFAIEEDVPEGKSTDEYAQELYERVETLVGEKLGEYETN